MQIQLIHTPQATGERLGQGGGTQVKTVRQVIDIILGRADELGHALNHPPGILTEVALAGAAEMAPAAAVVGVDGDPVAGLERCDIFAHLHHDTGYLMSQRHGIGYRPGTWTTGKLVKIRSAEATVGHGDFYGIVIHGRLRELGKAQILRAIKNSCMHICSSLKREVPEGTS
jgi:hypothetical protein